MKQWPPVRLLLVAMFSAMALIACGYEPPPTDSISSAETNNVQPATGPDNQQPVTEASRPAGIETLQPGPTTGHQPAPAAASPVALSVIPTPANNIPPERMTLSQLQAAFVPIESEDFQHFLTQLPKDELACLLDNVGMERITELQKEYPSDEELRAIAGCSSANTYIRLGLNDFMPETGDLSTETLACLFRRSLDLDTVIASLFTSEEEHPVQRVSTRTALALLSDVTDWSILTCLNVEEATFADRDLNDIKQLRCLLEDVGFTSMVELSQFLPGEILPEHLSSQIIGCGPFGETIISEILSVDWRIRASPRTRLYTFDEEAMTHVEVAHHGRVVSYARRPDRSGWANQDNSTLTLNY